MEIKILGSGCTKCKLLEKNAREAVMNLKIDADIIKVEDFNEIMSFNILSTPALVINNEVVSTGKLLNVQEIEKMFK